MISPSDEAELADLRERLINNEDEMRSNTARGLRRYGYTVLEAPNGKQAFELCERHKGPIDLLLTDADMPRMGGMELAAAFMALHPNASRASVTGEGATASDDLFHATFRKPISLARIAVELRVLRASLMHDPG